MSGLLRFLGLTVLVAFAATGCSEIRGRRKIQHGNKLYRDGLYQEAVATFVEAERLVPDFWVLWLNKGYTCRQMIIPGAKTPESLAAAKCAISAFKRLQELKPEDSRGELLYLQTLFDAEEFDVLAKMYGERYQRNPRDIETISGLIQVYSKWNKVDDALEWYTKKAEIQTKEPEAQYAVGVFLWQQLMQKGGGPDKASWLPYDPKNPNAKPVPPSFSYGDIVSQQRVDLADKGVEYLHKALALRPKYPEAMTYINLLYRQKSFAYFAEPEEWQKCLKEAEIWRIKTLEAQGKPVTASPVAPSGGDPTSSGGDGAPAEAAPSAGPGARKRNKKAARKARRGRK